MKNPYSDSLNGLRLDNPVSAFFNFCIEREKIRHLRESGAPYPWTKDPIFKKGRFLNVFREDDRVSKSIISFAQDCDDLPTLINALFFSRWCNKQQVLDELDINMLLEPSLIIKKLKYFDQWSNVNAYPVENINWKKKNYSRFDAATNLFPKIKNEITEIIINSEKDVIKATNAINARFKMKNNFPIFMAIMDIAWFRPDVIDPKSDVPTGIGAVPFLDLLQEYLGLKNHQETCKKMIQLQNEYWPEAKRKFQPIDIEYLSCENRKYYSYVNDTKKFEGKNLFIPLEKV